MTLYPLLNLHQQTPSRRDPLCRLNLTDYYDSKGYKRITFKPEEEKHIKWTVLAQVAGHNYLAIADEYETDAANVRKFVLKYLTLINLPVREGLVGAGRPIGVIEKYPRGSR